MRYPISIVALIVCLGCCATAIEAQQTVPAAPSKSATGPQRWALLVGVNDYAEISDLKYCGRDIQLLRRRLIAAGFPEKNVTLLHEGVEESRYKPIRSQIQKQLDALLSKVGPDDLVLFAFSGHGVELDGTSYLCPIEAQWQAPKKTMISLGETYRKLAGCKARQKLLLIDACRNDPRTEGERSVDKAPDTSAGFVRALARPPEGILVLSSCKPGQVSVEDDRMGHGVFMHFLLRGLSGEADREGGNRDGQVSLFELYRYTQNRTRTHVARTRDLIQTPTLRGEITGDYDLAGVPRRAVDVESAWKTVRDNPELFLKDSPVMKILERGYDYQMSRILPSGSVAQSMIDQQRLRQRNQMRSPQTVVLCNPTVITADDPAALLALQRAFAFGLRGDYNSLIEAASEAIRIEPENPFGYLLRGMGHSAKSMSLMGAGHLLSGESWNRKMNFLNERRDRLTADMRQRMRDRQLDSIARGLESSEAAWPGITAEIQELIAEGMKDPERMKELSPRMLEVVNTKAENSMLSAAADLLNIGSPVFVHLQKGTEFKQGDTVVHETKQQMETCEVLGVKGKKLRVKRQGHPDQNELWIPAENAMCTSVFSIAENLTKIR